MKKTEKAAKAELGNKHGIVTHKGGSEAGSVNDGRSPTVVLKHGIIARITKGSARRA